MPPLEMSKKDSFYQLACHTTDTFTSCIMIYEALLPYFEVETLSDDINRRIFNLGGMLNTLYNELTALKNMITTTTTTTTTSTSATATTTTTAAAAAAAAAAAIVVSDDKVSDPSTESKGVTQMVSEHDKKENIISEAGTVEQNESIKEKVPNELPKRTWEDVRQVPDEEHKRENVSHEDSKVEQTISHDEKVLTKSTENLRKQANDFGYICGNCKEAITVYNQDLDLSVALHNQDGCCKGKPSKLIAVQKERQREKINIGGAQEQVQNLTKQQEANNRLNFTHAQKNTVYKVRDTHFSCIQSSGNNFICTVCNKMLSGPKIFVQHVRGNYHQNCLKEIKEKTGYGKNITHAQFVKNSVEQKESVPSDAHLFGIIKQLSGSLYSQMQYLSVGKGVIMCNLCARPIPPAVTNVRDHVLGSRHSKNETELQSSNNK